jgi:hypothetical protein
MSKKVQSQLLVAPTTRDRADALALVIPDTRAEVYRRALEGGGLPGLEATYAEQLAQLDPIAGYLGLTRLELAARMVAEELQLNDWDPAAGVFRDIDGKPVE